MAKTENQTAFDNAKHGWSFANIEGLIWRIEQCEEIAKRLSRYDIRQDVLVSMKEALRRLKEDAA